MTQFVYTSTYLTRYAHWLQAQLSLRDRARFVEYFAKSLKISQGHSKWHSRVGRVISPYEYSIETMSVSRTVRRTDGQTSCHSIVRAMHTRRAVKMWCVQIYCWPALRARHAMLDNVGPSVCCPSPGHISKTKQDRPIVTTDHYIYRSCDRWFWCHIEIPRRRPPPLGSFI